MLPADKTPPCPECEPGQALARRDFIRVLGTTAAVATAVGGGLTTLQQARAARAEKQAQAEAMIFDLFKTLSADQKAKITRPWDHKPTAADKVTGRLATGNGAVGGLTIEKNYDKKQVELLDKIFRAIANGEQGYKELSRNGRFDNSNDFESISAIIYGEPAEGKKFSLVFTGHHLTVRCDGNTEQGTAFGGPLYYGHSPSGYATTNVFYHQTRSLMDLFGSLSDEQKQAAVKPGTWRDGVDSVRLPRADYRAPGVGFNALTRDQKGLVERVMRELVSPYRREDGDEVMEIVRANGGMEKLGFAFYTEGERTAREPWTFWRLEGPGFVWSFRSLPHIHTFVNVSSRIA